MKFPKLVIISDGSRAAILLNGVLLARGIRSFSFDSQKEKANAIGLSFDNIDAEAFSVSDAQEFGRIWDSFLS